MKKILCPTDFSEASHNGIAYAAKFAQVTGAELILFNVQSTFETTSEEAMHGKSLQIAAVKSRLEDQSLEVSKTFKISCYAEVDSSTGSFIERIREKAEGFDLIIMGTNGTDDLYDYFFGSHSYKMVHATHVPLLLIPSDCVYNEIRLMVYAFDYLRDRKLPMNQIVPWIKTVKTELRVLQVMEEAYSEEAEQDLKDIQQLITLNAKGLTQLQFDTIHSDDITTSINSYMLRHDADILALCTQERNFLENIFHKSVIKVLSSIASYPVFIFHE